MIHYLQGIQRQHAKCGYRWVPSKNVKYYDRTTQQIPEHDDRNADEETKVRNPEAAYRAIYVKVVSISDGRGERYGGVLRHPLV